MKTAVREINNTDGKNCIDVDPGIQSRQTRF